MWVSTSAPTSRTFSLHRTSLRFYRCRRSPMSDSTMPTLTFSKLWPKPRSRSSSASPTTSFSQSTPSVSALSSPLFMFFLEVRVHIDERAREKEGKRATQKKKNEFNAKTTSFLNAARSTAGNHRRGSELSRVRAMPCSSSVNSTEDNGALCNFKLNESTFLASLMPKKEIKADRFIEAHPDFDGGGVVIAIFAAGLQVTSDGKPKILDVIDCAGSGDIDTSNVVKADADGCLCGASGASLVVNSSWKNPSGEWHVGYKLVYELFTGTLTSRLKKERKKKWDEKHQEAIAEAVKCLDEFDKKHVKVKDANLNGLVRTSRTKLIFCESKLMAMMTRGLL